MKQTLLDIYARIHDPKRLMLLALILFGCLSFLYQIYDIFIPKYTQRYICGKYKQQVNEFLDLNQCLSSNKCMKVRLSCPFDKEYNLNADFNRDELYDLRMEYIRNCGVCS